MRSVSGRPLTIALCLAVAIVATTWSGSIASGPPPAAFDVTRFLTADVGLSAAELQRLERGDVVAKGLRADDATVAIVTAAVMAVTSDFFLTRFRQIEQFKKSTEVQQIGRLGGSPAARELAGLTLETSELKDARGCRVGHCAFKLDAAGIDRLRTMPDDQAAIAALRAHLAEYVAAYLHRGNAALMEYHDRSRPLAMNGQIERILANSPYLPREWPALSTVIGGFAGTLPQGLEHFVYWSKEKVGPRPVVSITHAIVQPPRDGIAIIATKQLYASHYTTGSLGLTLMADRSGDNGPRTLVVYINRTRVDIFEGVFGAVKRPLVRSRARSGAERMMTGLRARLETDFKHGLHGLRGSHGSETRR
jgi:hypothetical protein